MKLEGIGVIDLDTRAEWAAAFLYECHVEDRLYEWELVTDMNGRRAKFTFHGAADEWLYGVEQAWAERFPNVALEVDHAKQVTAPNGRIAEAVFEAVKRLREFGVKDPVIVLPPGMHYTHPKLFGLDVWK